MINESIYESGDGGNLVNLNNDIARTDGLATLSYLRMFGGNVNESTQRENTPGEFRFDWWGNKSSDNSESWLNSETEKTLRGIELSGAAIVKIRQSVEKDLKILEQYGEFSVVVTLPSVNSVQITTTIKEPSRKDSNTLIVIWNATKKEIIEQKII